jgi:hypothetical protein
VADHQIERESLPARMGRSHLVGVTGIVARWTSPST